MWWIQQPFERLIYIGNPHIYAYFQLPEAFRCLLRLFSSLEDKELFLSRSTVLPSMISESFAAKLLATTYVVVSICTLQRNMYKFCYILDVDDHYRATELKSTCLKYFFVDAGGEFSCLTLPPNILSIVVVLKTNGFKYLKENCPLLKTQLLKTGKI
ncbi:BTB/POZ and MATH domain-containing protein 4, partial [Mucuna pruriens]